MLLGVGNPSRCPDPAATKGPKERCRWHGTDLRSRAPMETGPSGRRSALISARLVGERSFGGHGRIIGPSRLAVRIPICGPDSGQGLGFGGAAIAARSSPAVFGPYVRGFVRCSRLRSGSRIADDTGSRDDGLRGKMKSESFRAFARRRKRYKTCRFETSDIKTHTPCNFVRIVFTPCFSA